MKAIVIEIIRLLSDDYPGFVECRFIDAWQKEHIIQEKIPVVSDLLFSAHFLKQFINCQISRALHF
jgi:hypothetical protein